MALLTLWLPGGWTTCLPCWKQLLRCVSAAPCSGVEKIRPTVEVMAARILRDCPVENFGPCPIFECEECPVCSTCEPCVTPTITTALTTTHTTTTSTPCQRCDCSKKELQDCRDSLSFVDLSKGGAQNSRTTWREEAERLAKVVTREKNSTASYKLKWEEVLKLFQESQTGYSKANDTIEFTVKLVNEHSGRANSCEATLTKFQNTTNFLSIDLQECKNKTVQLTSSMETQTTNFTTYGRFLRVCRRSLKESNTRANDSLKEISGNCFQVNSVF